jgi:hypothetical protein
MGLKWMTAWYSWGKEVIGKKSGDKNIIAVMIIPTTCPTSRK